MEVPFIFKFNVTLYGDKSILRDSGITQKSTHNHKQAHRDIKPFNINQAEQRCERVV